MTVDNTTMNKTLGRDDLNNSTNYGWGQRANNKWDCKHITLKTSVYKIVCNKLIR